MGVVLIALLVFGYKFYQQYQRGEANQAYLDSVTGTLQICAEDGQKLVDHAQIIKDNPDMFNGEWKSAAKDIFNDMKTSCGTISKEPATADYAEAYSYFVESDRQITSSLDEYIKAVETENIDEIKTADEHMQKATEAFKLSVEKLNETTQRLSNEPLF